MNAGVPLPVNWTWEYGSEVAELRNLYEKVGMFGRPRTGDFPAGDEANLARQRLRDLGALDQR